MKSMVLGLVMTVALLLAAPQRADACEGCGCGAKAGKDAPAVFGAPEGGCPHAREAAASDEAKPSCAEGKDCAAGKEGCACQGEGGDAPCKDCPCKKDGTCPCKDGKACAACKDCPCKKDGRCQCGHGGQCPHHGSRK